MRVLRSLIGRVFNFVGVPGLVHPSACQDRLGVPVEVKVGPKFTVVSVQNMRLLFHRLTGKLDGVVIDQADCSKTSHHQPTA